MSGKAMEAVQDVYILIYYWLAADGMHFATIGAFERNADALTVVKRTEIGRKTGKSNLPKSAKSLIIPSQMYG